MRIRDLFRSGQAAAGFTFSRPLVALQSDDWGRVGVRDQEGYEQLRSAGLRLGQHPYDLFTLETAQDVNALGALLLRHHDSTGRHPCLVMNFCTANLDFDRMRAEDYKSLEFLPAKNGLPGKWRRPGLFEAYRSGIQQGTFLPALHGSSHLSALAVENALRSQAERAKLLRTLWQAETPYIYWRMPWIGYEYWNPDGPHAGFLSSARQNALIERAVQNFTAFFSQPPVSACAPGYRANSDTHRAWSRSGIHVAESGTGSGLRAPHLDEFGLLHLYRNIDFEPSQREVDLEKYLEIAGVCFARGLPFIISVHSINFHSTLKDFCTPTLSALDALLTDLESKYPDLLYVHDEDFYQIVTTGSYRSQGQHVSVGACRQESNSHFAGAL